MNYKTTTQNYFIVQTSQLIEKKKETTNDYVWNNNKIIMIK